MFEVWTVSGTGLEKDAEKAGNETLHNLENGVPVHTGKQFSFSPRHPATVQVQCIYDFIGGPLPMPY